MAKHDFITKITGAQNSLFSFAMKLTTNRDDASDLVQDTTLKALSSHDKYADCDNFKGWIFTIMRNTFLNRVRSSSRASVVSTDTDEAQNTILQAPAASPQPDSMMAAGDITDIIAKMPTSYSRPFTMLMEGYTYEEISKELDMPVNIVKSHIYHTRKKLRALLSD